MIRRGLPSGCHMKLCKNFRHSLSIFFLCRDPEHKCKLSCFNRLKQSYYTTPENVLDGTPCSYDQPSNLCVQVN